MLWAFMNFTVSFHLWMYSVLNYKKWSVPVTGPVVTQRVGRGIALFFHDFGARRGWVVSSTPRSHFTPGRDPVLIYSRLDGPQDRSGEVRKILPQPGYFLRVFIVTLITVMVQLHFSVRQNNQSALA
jgi:hypothetical protein